MNRTWLIQRLEDPAKITNPEGLLAKLGKDNPFAFGGGLPNGGISKEWMAVLREFLAFDYMGAAEFEFGAVPKALQMMVDKAKVGKLTAFEITGLPKPVYGICATEDVAEVKQRITGLAKEQYNRNLKEATRLHDALNPETVKYPVRVKGWLELDNGFFFTVSKDMQEGMSALFGVSVTAEKENQ